MKRMMTAFLLAGLCGGVAAQTSGFVPADNGGQAGGGFTGQTPGVVSALQARNLPDDTWVVLEGNIVRQTGYERYEFRDGSGTITVDIDDEDWLGQRVSSNDRVRLGGEVDRTFTPAEIDVKSVRRLSPVNP